jgi:hypothetical protein
MLSMPTIRVAPAEPDAGTAAPDAGLGPDAISALARQHARAAIDTLVASLSNPDERVAAAIALLDVGYGQPVQPIALDSTHGVALEVHTVEAPDHRSANGEDAEDGAAWRAWLRQRGS